MMQMANLLEISMSVLASLTMSTGKLYDFGALEIQAVYIFMGKCARPL